MDLASRARIKKGLDSGRIMEWQKRARAAKESGQNDLFSQRENEILALELEEANPWTLMEALEEERKVVGFYLSGHPLDGFFEKLDYALWLNKLKKQNDIKYGSCLLNRHNEETLNRGKRYVRKFR